MNCYFLSKYFEKFLKEILNPICTYYNGSVEYHLVWVLLMQYVTLFQWKYSFENNLVEVIKLLDSEAVLVQSEKVKKDYMLKLKFDFQD